MRLGTLYRQELLNCLGIHPDGERVLDVGAFDGYWLSSQRGVLRVAADFSAIRAIRRGHPVRWSPPAVRFRFVRWQFRP